MAVDSILLNPAIFSINHNNKLQRRRSSSKFPLIPTSIKTRSFPVTTNYKQYDFQDFQGYAKPSRLLGATEPKFFSETFQREDFASFTVGRSQALYKVKLLTSNAFGSSLSDQNAGILLCLIDTNGDSILQRIPVILKSNSVEPTDLVEPIHFQRGCFDEFVFEGLKLEKIEALWVSVESGQWRLAGASLTVINVSQNRPEKNDLEKLQFTSLQYEFEADDVLLGEGSDVTIIELRPNTVSELSGAEPFNFPSESTATSGGKISYEESMKEYANLKLSLLSYDAALVFSGTILANFLSGENEAFAFFFGGLGGFLYLLLLQRSVDELPVSQDTGETGQLFKGLKGPITGLVLAIGLISVALKYRSGDFAVGFASKELLVGMTGFLACKVAVVIAAFRPLSLGLKEPEM